MSKRENFEMMIRKCAFVSIAMLAIAAPAFALNGEQVSALTKIGQLNGGMMLCDKLAISDAVLAAIMVANRLDPTNVEQAKIMRDVASSTIDAGRGKSADASCADLISRFGPEGNTVPGLVKLK